MLDQKLAEAMQRVLAKGEDRFTLTGTLQRLVDDGIGTKRGKSVYFTDKDRDEIRAWLNAKGYSLEWTDLVGMNRSKRLAVTPNEKAGGEAVKQNRVSVKALGGQPLMIAGEILNLPHESHLDADWIKIANGLGHRCIMVVENYENFNRIHETTFKLPDECRSPLVVYRGDPHESRFDNVHKFLAHIDLPVLAFTDADPAGIAIASQLPNLVGVVLPSWSVLEAQLRSPRTSRKDLFYDQYPVYGKMLEKLGSEHSCRRLWELVSKYKAGVVQERWIGNDDCEIFSS